MGHRNMFNTPQIFETESHQEGNHTEQPYRLIGRASVSESSSLGHPEENININGGPFPSLSTAAPMSRINSSSISYAEMPCFPQQAPAPSRDHFLHQPAGGNFHMVPNGYSCLPSSSSLGGQTMPGAQGGFVDQITIGSKRGPYKRKSPSTLQLYNRGATSRFYAGSSSNFFLPADPWQEKHNTEPSYMPWEYGPGYRVNSLSISGEGMQRNVRSRTVVDHDRNQSKTNMPSNSLCNAFSHRPCDRSNLMDRWGQTSNTSTRDWNHGLISPAGHGGTRGTDSSSFVQGPNTLNAPNGYTNNSVENRGYSNNTSIPQNNYGYLNQSRREVQSSYDHRPVVPAFRASTSCFYPGQVASSGEGQVLAAESFPSGHSQAFSILRFRHSERNGRTWIANDSLPEHVAHEGTMAMNYPAYYGDQHRDMRLDVDNMSYEELLALGERIGTVSTGLSDGLVSNCLTLSVSGQCRNQGRCVICLEEYKSMDDIGTMKCGHDFHVGCIGKWLSMKNLCPICKAPAMDDSSRKYF